MNIASLAQALSQNLTSSNMLNAQQSMQSLMEKNLQGAQQSVGESFQNVLNNSLNGNENSFLSGTQIGASGSQSLPGSNQVFAANEATQADGTLMFKDIYSNLVTNVNLTDSAFQADIVKAAKGELENPHQLLIDSEKAQVSLQFAISMRNKALEAYNDIIRMQV